MTLSGVLKAVRNGLVIRNVLDRLGALGLKVELYVVFREDVACHVLHPAPEDAEVEVALLGPTDMEQVARIHGRGEAREAELLGRLAEGKVCIAAKQGDRIVAFMWCDLREFNYEASPFALEENEAYLYGAWTAESHRGRGLAPRLRRRCYELLGAMGKDTFYSYSDVFNRPAMRFKDKLGAQRLALGLHLSVGRRFSRSWRLRSYRAPKP